MDKTPLRSFWRGFTACPVQDQLHVSDRVQQLRHLHWIHPAALLPLRREESDGGTGNGEEGSQGSRRRWSDFGLRRGIKNFEGWRYAHNAQELSNPQFSFIFGSNKPE